MLKKEKKSFLLNILNLKNFEVLKANFTDQNLKFEDHKMTMFSLLALYLLVLFYIFTLYSQNVEYLKMQN